MQTINYVKIISTQSPTPTKITRAEKIINNKIVPCSLFIVEQLGKKFVYKISDPITAHRNLMLSQILTKSGVIVPDSKIFIGLGGTYFERYEIMSGQTLASAIKNKTVSDSQIINILQDVLTYDRKISKIHIKDTKINEQLDLVERRKYHNTKDFGKFLANILYIINKHTMARDNISIHHADLNPSNILLNHDGKFIGFLDLDSIALCNEYTMLLQITTTWPNISMPQITKMYKNIYEHDIDTNHMRALQYCKKIKKTIAHVLRNIQHKH